MTSFGLFIFGKWWKCTFKQQTFCKNSEQPGDREARAADCVKQGGGEYHGSAADPDGGVGVPPYIKGSVLLQVLPRGLLTISLDRTSWKDTWSSILGWLWGQQILSRGPGRSFPRRLWMTFFDRYEMVAGGIPKTHVFNCDVSNLWEHQGNHKALFRRGVKYTEQVRDHTKNQWCFAVLLQEKCFRPMSFIKG